MCISLAKLRDSLARRRSDPVNHKGCVEWQGARTGDGYGRLCVPWEVEEGGEVKIKRSQERVSRMIYLTQNNLNLKNDLPRPPMEMSHLCHTRLCMLPDHLVVEPKAINLERRHCVNQGICMKSHEGYPHCILW